MARPHEMGDDAFEAGQHGPQALLDQNEAASYRPGMRLAIDTAIDESDVTQQHDPDLVAQITAHVLEALQAKKLTSTGAPATSQKDPLSAISPDTGSYMSRRQSIPQTLHGDTSKSLRQPAPSVLRQATAESPTSPLLPQIPSRYTPSTSSRSSSGSSSPEPSPRKPVPNTSKEASRPRRDSRSSMSSQEDNLGARNRPRPVRIPSAIEETSLEKAWKPLFLHGKPTARLGQFLRGLAKHIIERYEPQNSLVVTPGKLANFFEFTKRSEETYPWTSLFGGQLTNSAITRLFCQLQCQHHLIQLGTRDVPCIPGLTPQGFETFLTILILAHPDQEFRRLDTATKHIPISDADDSSDRFPKQLPRRLLPARADTNQQQYLVAALATVQNRGQTTGSSMPSVQPPLNSQIKQSSIHTERERAPYAGHSHTSALDDDDLRATLPPIERERKPYTAREGGGKVHSDRQGSVANSVPEMGSRSSKPSSALPIRKSSISTGGRLDQSSSGTGIHRSPVDTAAGLRYATGAASVPSHSYTRSDVPEVIEKMANNHGPRSAVNDEQAAWQEARQRSRRATMEDDSTDGE